MRAGARPRRSAARCGRWNTATITWGRLTTVTADLTPADGSIADGVVFVTNYTYDDTTSRIASVTQSDGTSVFFTYDAAGRVRTVKDQSGATSTQLVFTYSPATNSTAITDGNGQVWTYRYDGRPGS